jgi:hypothetical protein
MSLQCRSYAKAKESVIDYEDKMKKFIHFAYSFRDALVIHYEEGDRLKMLQLSRRSLVKADLC